MVRSRCFLSNVAFTSPKIEPNSYTREIQARSMFPIFLCKKMAMDVLHYFPLFILQSLFVCQHFPQKPFLGAQYKKCKYDRKVLLCHITTDDKRCLMSLCNQHLICLEQPHNLFMAFFSSRKRLTSLLGAL